MRFILWEQTDDGEIPHEFLSLDEMWEFFLKMPGEFLSTFEAITENEDGRQTIYTIEDTQMEKYYES